MTHRPRRFIVSTPAGGAHEARGPAHAIRPFLTTTTASGTGGPPAPFTSVAPTRATGAGGVPRGAANAVLTAIFQPPGVRTKMRSLVTLEVSPRWVTR